MKSFTWIKKGNEVYQFNYLNEIKDEDKSDVIVIDDTGVVIVNNGNPITWPTEATNGLQAIVDVKAGTLRFGHDELIRLTEFVVSEYVAPAPVEPKAPATREDAMKLVETWPIHLEKNGEKVTGNWVWGGLNGVTVIVNQISGKTITESDWKEYRSQSAPSVEDSAPVHVLDLIKEWPSRGSSPGALPDLPGFKWNFHEGKCWSICGMNGDTKFFEGHWLNYHENKKKYSGVSVQVGTKHDHGKPILGAVPPHAELAVGRVLTFGAEKYARGNWDKVEDHENRYMDAALRHLNAHRRGELTDSESGESHLAHAACCILFMLDKQERS